MGRHAILAVRERLFERPEDLGHMRARWGSLPENSTLDPTTFKPVDKPTWILAVDAFVVGERAFEPSQVAAQATSLAERCYASCRWPVTHRFPEHLGGKP